MRIGDYITITAYGTSEGVRHAWDTRGRGPHDVGRRIKPRDLPGWSDKVTAPLGLITPDDKFYPVEMHQHDDKARELGYKNLYDAQLKGCIHVASAEAYGLGGDNRVTLISDVPFAQIKDRLTDWVKRMPEAMQQNVTAYLPGTDLKWTGDGWHKIPPVAAGRQR